MTTTPAPTETSTLLTGTAVGPFATGWKYAEPADVQVRLLIDGVAGAALTPTTHYTLTASDPLTGGGSVTLAAGLVPAGGWAADSYVVLSRVTARRQGVAMEDTEGFRPKAAERAHDKAMRIAEEDRDRLGRAVTVPYRETGLTVPSVAKRAGRVAAFDDAGQFDPAAPMVANLLEGATFAEEQAALALAARVGAEAALAATDGVLASIEASSAQLYLTTVATQGADIPGAVTAFRVHGYATAGDGGAAAYVEVPNTGAILDGQITTNGGSRRWELSPEGGRVHVAQFGAFPGVHLDADTEALWNAFSAKPSLAHIRRIDFFISELKKHGVWQKLDGLYVFAAQSASDILINWKNPAFNPLTVFAGTPRLLPGVGLRGDAVTCQLRGTVNMNAFPQFAQDSAHIGVGVRGQPVAGQSADMNAVGGPAGMFIQLTDANAFNARLNDLTTRAFTNVFTTGRLRHIERHGAHFIASRDDASGYSVDRSGYAFGQGTITDRASTGVSTAPLNVYVYPDANTTDVTAKVTQFAHVGAALDVVDRKILYRHLRDLMTDIPAVLGGEPSTQAWVDGPAQTATQTRQRVQAALDFAAARKVECHFGDGVYLTDGQLFLPSHSRVHGMGRRSTTIRLDDGVSISHNVLLAGYYDNRRRDIEVSDLLCDFNWRRRANPDATLYDPKGNVILGNTAATAVSASNLEHSKFYRVGAMNPGKHCFDVTAPTYGRSLGSVLIYSPEPSRHVVFEECWAYQGGDDNFTSHNCESIWFVRCESIDPQGSYVGENANCYEIDEGSRNVWVVDSIGIGGTCGMQIKGHGDSAAPYNITVSGCRFINNVNPIEIRHSSWYGPASAAQTELDTIRPPDGSQYLSSGFSPTGRNVVISDCQVIAPAVSPLMDYARTPGASVGICVWIRAYESIQITNLLISEGQLDVAQDYWMADDLADNLGLMRIYDGGRHTQITNLTINGFSYCDMGLYIPSTLDGPLIVNGFTSINGPRKAVRSLAANVLVNNLNISRDRAGPNDVFPTVGVDMAGAGNILGLGYIRGYDQTVLGNPRLVYQPVEPYTVATFANSADGFAAFSGAALTPGAGGLTLSYVGASNGYMAKTAGIAINGNVYRKVKIDIERTVARATGAWEGSLYYTTAGHAAGGGYLKTIDNTNDMAVGVRKTITFDMAALTAGGDDWITNTITGLRLDLETLSGGTFIVHSITVEP